MPTTAEILTTEDQNQSRIYLYSEGMFLKAYQKSAYMFLRDNGPMKPTKKFVQAVGKEVVSIGFPSVGLLKYCEPGEIVKTGERSLYVDCAPIDEDGYLEWFRSVDVKIKETKREAVQKAVRYETAPEEKTIKKLREFRLENSTPMDCMLFIRELQREIL